MFSYFFDGYWKDIGTISSFFEAHLDLTRPLHEFDFYESREDEARKALRGIPEMGIGHDSEIRNAIIDKNARIGHHVKLLNIRDVQEEIGRNHVITGGIIVVPKQAVIPHGTIV